MGGKKLWLKAETFHCTTVLLHITFKSKCETNDKNCPRARAGKTIYFCAIFRMYTQLHTQANQEI